MIEKRSAPAPDSAMSSTTMRYLVDAPFIVALLDPMDLGSRLDARERTLARMWDDRLRDQVVEVPAFDATWR